MITIGLCITWGGAVLVAAYFTCERVFKSIHLVTILQSVQLAGIGIFQASALQFGTDQLKDASSDQLSLFVHCYVWAQEISGDSYDFVKVAIDSILSNHALLIEQLLVAMVASFALCFRIVPASKWMFEQQLIDNPYRLIYGALRYAWKHKQPVKRSAFTFWERNIPSRIELGKSKYGGPYTNENIEDVKTFFRIVKLLLSLTGFFICRNGFQLTQITECGSLSQPLLCNGIVIGLILCSLPIHELAIYPFTRSLYPGIVKRIFIGAILTLIAEYIALILFDASRLLSVHIAPMTWIVPNICSKFGYLIFTISLLEFIVAQSPQSMRGLLIGVYYCIAYGVSQFAAWLLYEPFKHPDNALHKLIYLGIAAAVGIVGLAIFARVVSEQRER